VELPLLTGIAAYCVWPHRHRARMHLSIICLLKSRGDLAVASALIQGGFSALASYQFIGSAARSDR
jgi:hypothetical protein